MGGGGAYKGRFTVSDKVKQNITEWIMRIECEIFTKTRYRRRFHGYVRPLKSQT